MNEMENNGGSTNSNLTNNPSSTNTNQQQDFNLDDLNFDPAALIGGNGENTDLNVSIVESYKYLFHCDHDPGNNFFQCLNKYKSISFPIARRG